MPSIVLRDLTGEEYAYLKTAAALTQSPVLGFCLHAAIEHAAMIIENSGLQGAAKPTRPDSMRRRGPLTAIEQVGGRAVDNAERLQQLENEISDLQYVAQKLRERLLADGMTDAAINALVMDEEPPF